MKEMKTLTILGNTYEVVDDKARTSIENLYAEKPININMSGFDNELIVLTYADGSTMDVKVTFDDSGNPIKFSAKDFTITWSEDEENTEATE